MFKKDKFNSYMVVTDIRGDVGGAWGESRRKRNLRLFTLQALKK